VLLLIPHFLPGSRFGGPVRTVGNLLALLGDLFDFHVLTRDRDFQSEQPYPLPANRWLDWCGLARVRYADSAGLKSQALKELGRELRPDLLYLNSFFHPRFSLLPYQLWRRGAFGGAPLVLAPRGEFAPSALAQKALKKRLFLAAARWTGGYQEALWQASSAFEAEDICRVMGVGARIQVAPNLGMQPVDPPPREKVKEPGCLRLVFLGRISPMKNLDFLLNCLPGLPGRIELSVAGPAEDRQYLARCTRIAATLPVSVTVRFLGAVPPQETPRLLRNHDLLFQPSLGENFGHAILEALQLGLPVLTSDRTPWRGLEAQRAGWDLPLEQPERFREVLRKLLPQNESDWSTWSAGAGLLGLAHCRDEQALRLNVDLFQRAMAEARPQRPR